jgi:hypothetical protein
MSENQQSQPSQPMTMAALAANVMNDVTDTPDADSQSQGDDSPHDSVSPAIDTTAAQDAPAPAAVDAPAAPAAPDAPVAADAPDWQRAYASLSEQVGTLTTALQGFVEKSTPAPSATPEPEPVEVWTRLATNDLGDHAPAHLLAQQGRLYQELAAWEAHATANADKPEILAQINNEIETRRSAISRGKVEAGPYAEISKLQAQIDALTNKPAADAAAAKRRTVIETTLKDPDKYAGHTPALAAAVKAGRINIEALIERVTPGLSADNWVTELSGILANFDAVLAVATPDPDAAAPAAAQASAPANPAAGAPSVQNNHAGSAGPQITHFRDLKKDLGSILGAV